MAMYPTNPMTVIAAATVLQEPDIRLRNALTNLRLSLEQESERDVTRRDRIWARIAAAVEQLEERTIPTALR
jgi:hypothetical protein